MNETKTVVFSENAYVPDETQKIPFYIRHQGFVFLSLAVIILTAMISLKNYAGFIFILFLIPILCILFKSLSNDKMKLEKMPVSLSFDRDRLVVTRDKIYVTSQVSRKECYTFLYKDLRELKYNKEKKELIIHGDATIEYTGYNKKQKLNKKAALKHDAPCFFAMYPEDNDECSFKSQLAKSCPYPIDYTNTESMCSNLNK